MSINLDFWNNQERKNKAKSTEADAEADRAEVDLAKQALIPESMKQDFIAPTYSAEVEAKLDAYFNTLKEAPGVTPNWNQARAEGQRQRMVLIETITKMTA